MKSQQEIEIQQRAKLKELIEWVGSQTRLAHELGVTKQVVNNWVARGRISAACAILVEEKTAGLFTKEALRPDVTVWSNSNV